MSGMKTLLVIFLCGLVTCHGQINPGLNGKVTSSGIQLVKDVVVGWATDWLKTFKFPDYNGAVSFSNLDLQSFSFGDVDITTASPNAAHLTINGASLHLTGDLYAKVDIGWWTWDVSAGFSIMATNIGGKLGVIAGANTAGGLTIDIVEDSCDVNIGNISPEITKTDFDYIATIAAKLISDPVAKWLAAQACPALEQGLKTQGDRLSNAIPTTFKLPWFPISVDIGLVKQPAIDAQSITLGMKGVAFPTDNPLISFPFVAPPLQQPSGWLKSAYVVLSDYSVNTFLYTTWSTGLLDNLASYVDISVALPFQLTAKGLSPLIPGLAQYGNSTLKVGYVLPKAPIVEFMPDYMNISGCVEVVVNLTGGELEQEIEAFVLNLDFEITGGVVIVGTNITGYVREVYGNFTTVDTNIGEVPVGFFNKIVGAFVPKKILPQLNDLLEIGIEIPTYMGFSTSDEAIIIQQDSVEVAANIYHDSYHPK